MILIVGLGNPGEKYSRTRHNLGFQVLDEFLRKISPVEKTGWKFDQKSNSQFAIRNSQFILAKPQTMVNASGFAVKKLITVHQILITNLWVIHDDIDLPLGRLKIRLGGASAGHKGLESIIRSLGTDQFVRFRLGVSHPGPGSSEKETADYVLSEFPLKEKSAVRQLIKKTIKALQTGFDDSIAAAVNRFNQ